MNGRECLHPILLSDGYVPCGKCPNCRARQRYDLSTRIYLEQSFAQSAFFVTLTYSEEALPRNRDNKPCFDKRQVQLFIKRLRKSLGTIRMRYFLTCEYGDGKDAFRYLNQYGTEYGRPHYHSIIVLDHKLPLREMRDFVSQCWQLGRIQVNTSSMASIQYSTQYALKDEAYLYKDYEEGDTSKPFRLFSLRPGLGAGFGNDEKPIIRYLNEYLFNDGIHIRDRIRIAGRERGIPRYWKDRLDPSVSEELRRKGLDWLSDSQESLAETRESNSVYILGVRHNDYTKDNEILQKRKAIRKLRKLNKKNNL